MGWRSMAEAPWKAAPWVVLAFGLAALFVRWWTRGDAVAAPESGQGIGAWCLWLMLFGLGVFTLDWVPAWIVHIYTADSRLCYPAMVGLVVAGAAVATTAGSTCASAEGVKRFAAAHCLCGVVFTVIAIGFAVMMVGVQRAYRQRAEWEMRQLAELRAMIPEAPDRAVVVVMSAPLSTRVLPPTGDRSFDRAFLSVWENPWNVRWFVRWGYRREDLRATPSEGWPGAAILDIVAEGVRVSRLPINPAIRSNNPEGTVIPWRFVIPIIIAPDGHLCVVSDVRVKEIEAGPEVFRIEPPVVRKTLQMRPDQGQATRSVVFFRDGSHRIITNPPE
jgi:hypothetical protein